MKIGFYVPCYREQIDIHVSYEQVRAERWCNSHGHELIPWHGTSTNVARLRNEAIKQAREFDCDRLIMVDADCYSNTVTGLLGNLMLSMDDTGAAACGAVFACRKGDRVNCEPAIKRRVYEGEVGTGAMLFDMRQLERLPLPWFVDELNEDGTERVCGEDIYCCRYLNECGFSTFVDYTIDTSHRAEVPLRVGI